MTLENIRVRVLTALSKVAPEADPAQLRPDLSFRDQLDIDSMDFLNFIIALHRDFKMNIPETDYPKLAPLDGCTANLHAARGDHAAPLCDGSEGEKRER